MKTVVVYRPNSEFARQVEDFSRDMKRQFALDVELVSIDTLRGDQLARLYGIVRYPAVIVTRASGELVQLWVDDNLPLMAEVAGYARS